MLGLIENNHPDGRFIKHDYFITQILKGNSIPE